MADSIRTPAQDRRGFPARALPVGVLILYAVLVLPTVDRQGVNWDEQTDMEIASVYSSSLGDMVYGTRDDAINTRLPMYATGMVFRLAGRNDLLLARLLACVAGLLAIVAAYAFCALELDRVKGLVASAILATSPYFLYFSKEALSEGDVFITAATAWVMVAVAFWRARPDLGRAACVGLALGIAISAKISGIALVPAVGLVILLTPSDPSGRRPGFRPATLIVALGGFLAWMAVNAITIWNVYPVWGKSLSRLDSYPLTRLAVAGLLALLLARFVILGRRERPSAPWTVLAVMLVASMTFFLVPPVHVTNPWILGSLWTEFFAAGSGLDLGALGQDAVFHVLVVLIKSGLVAGALLWVALVVAVPRARRRSELRLPLLVFAFTYAIVVLLPWAQTRYMMPVLPVLAILAADAIVDLFRRRPRAAVALATLVAASVVAEFAMTYPDLNLSGYRWLGERYLVGRSTVGYRAIVHTPSDGIEQALRWLGDHASEGEAVMTVFGEDHILRAVLPDPPFAVRSPLRGPVALSEVDWVVTSINYDLRPPREPAPRDASIWAYPHYDRAELERDFSRVFSVRRAFGLEVAAVWRRR